MCSVIGIIFLDLEGGDCSKTYLEFNTEGKRRKKLRFLLKFDSFCIKLGLYLVVQTNNQYCQEVHKNGKGSFVHISHFCATCYWKGVSPKSAVEHPQTDFQQKSEKVDLESLSKVVEINTILRKLKVKVIIFLDLTLKRTQA